MADDDLLVRAAIRDELSGPLADIRRELARVGTTAEQTSARVGRSRAGFDKLSAGVGGLAKGAGRLAIGALAGIGVAAGVAAGGAVALGVKTAASMQTASIAFTTMLGSAQKAGAFLDKLRKFAAATPFEFPELQTAASSLISAGIEADKVIPIMTTLGNATSGMGTGSEGIKRATVALQQMNAAGKITGEDLNQLRDAGIPVYDLLSKATGKSKAAIADLAQKGKLGKKELDAMMKALASGKGLERFSGLMEKQSHTLAGVWSTLKDNVGQGLAAAFAPAIPTLTTMVDKLGALAGKYLPVFSAWLGRTMKSAGKFLGAFRDQGGLEALQRAGKAVIKILGSFIPKAGGASGMASKFSSAADKLAGALEWAAKHTTALKVAVIILAALFGGPITAVLAIGAAFVWAYTRFDGFAKVVRIGAAIILAGFAGMLKGIALFLRALAHIPGFGWAKTAADKVDKAADSVLKLADAVAGLKDKDVTVRLHMPAGNAAAKFNGKAVPVGGDTATSHARGGNLGRTLAFHGAISRPGGPRITNALTGGGGRGPGSGDHQRGQALDLNGPGLPGYAAQVRAGGGFAEYHGAGDARHLHAVPAGDTATSRATPGRSSSRSGGAPVVIGAGAIVVHQPGSNVDVARAVADGIDTYLRNNAERA